MGLGGWCVHLLAHRYVFIHSTTALADLMDPSLETRTSATQTTMTTAMMKAMLAVSPLAC